MDFEQKMDIPDDDSEDENTSNLKKENLRTETPRTRLDSMYANLNFRFSDYKIQDKFEKLIKEFPIDAEKEDAFIDALIAAINDFSDNNFLSSILNESAPKREEIVNQKIEEVKNKLSNQIDAVELAAKLSFNDSYLPMNNPAYKANNIALYLQSDETAYENEFDEKATIKVSPYFAYAEQPGGYRLILNGENVITFKETEIEDPKNMNKLSEIIKSLINIKEIKPREVINRFIDIKNNPESKACLLELLKKDSKDEIISYILE